MPAGFFRLAGIETRRPEARLGRGHAAHSWTQSAERRAMAVKGEDDGPVDHVRMIANG